MKQTFRQLQEQEDRYFYTNITVSEDEHTSMAKRDVTNTKRATIDAAHEPTTKPLSTLI